MKYIIIIGDGMADEAIAALGNRSPLQAAHTPAMDELACKGRSGLLQTVPEGIHPGSEVANLSVLGYDPRVVLEGRGSLEAASMGIPIEDGELVLRCNLVCIDGDGKIKSHSAGHISTGEAAELIDYLNVELDMEDVRFFPGVSYRHVLKIEEGNKQVQCTPPHDVLGEDFIAHLPEPLAQDESARMTTMVLRYLIFKSQILLPRHAVNLQRRGEGKDMANSIWPWSPGYKPQMKTLTERYPIRSGAVISAVDLIKGIGVYAGLEVINVPGATGLYDTNYEGKAQAAIAALRDKDFVYLHIEAPDEAGHEGDAQLKIRTIEDIDSRIVRPILDAVAAMDEPVTVALLPDHPTPCRIQTHTAEPVPFVIYKPGQPADQVTQYDEWAAQRGEYGLLRGEEFMEEIMK